MTTMKKYTPPTEAEMRFNQLNAMAHYTNTPPKSQVEKAFKEAAQAHNAETKQVEEAYRAVCTAHGYATPKASQHNFH